MQGLVSSFLQFLSTNRRFLIPIGLFHAAYFLAALLIGVVTTEDSPEYLHMAHNFMHGAVYSEDLSLPLQPKFLTLRPPGYSLFLLPWVLLSTSIYLVLLAQNLLSMVTLTGLYLLLKELLPDSKVGFWIFVGILLFPTGMIYTNMIMAEVLFQALMFWAFYYAVRYIRDKKERHLLLYNLLVTSALFVKPVLLYFWIPNLLFSIYIYTRHRHLRVLIMPLILPLLAFVYSHYNEARSGYFHFSCIKNINVLNFNARQLLRTQHGKAYSDSVITKIQEEAVALGSFKEEFEYMEQRGKELVFSNIIDYSYVHARGMLSFFLDPGRHDVVLFLDIKSEERMGFFNEVDKRGLQGIIHYVQHVNLWLLVLMATIFVWNLLLLVAWLHTVLISNLDIAIRAVLFLLVAYVAVLSVTIGYARFRVEVYPLLLFSLPFFIEHMRMVFKRSTK